MRRKFTILLFGLLLAVGWTSSASAQSVTKPTSYYQGLTYSWSDPTTGESGTDVPATQVATNPYQIYELLRFVYRDERFPGPTYSAYADDGTTREDPVYYGAIGGGWNLTSGGERDLIITTTSTYVNIRSIAVYAGTSTSGTPITSWSATETPAGTEQGENSQGQTTTFYYYDLPTGWTSSHKVYRFGSGTTTSPYVGYMPTGGTITIAKSLFAGQTNVTVVINGYVDQGYEAESFVVDGVTWLPNTSSTSASHSWAVNFTSNPDTDVKAPLEEGYTVLIVSLNNNLQLEPETDATYDYDSYFTTKDQLINYIRNNIRSVKLLTDGLRIGTGEGVGTVFNCSGTYNRFFFLGKGQARKKNGLIQSLEQQNNRLFGEQVPFKEMFEQFSPTSDRVSEESQTTDFYSKMMAGQIYNVIHDCPSVIQNQHYFSMAGRTGTTDYALEGMNFFIPDFRLKKWARSYTYQYYTSYYSSLRSVEKTIDGRDQNPIMDYNDETFPNYNERYGTNVNYSYFGSWWAVYDTLNNHSPKVGLYLITLDANASPSSTPQTYDVVLDWTSSLDQMTGSTVRQQYKVYIVLTDEEGNTHLSEEPIYVGENTTYTYQVPQDEHSYTITYIVRGTPIDDHDRPGFVAWSNEDYVIIPGLNDFMALKLDHYESDFVVNNEKNYYRNYLYPVNDILNGITPAKILAGEDSYILYRDNLAVAKLRLSVSGNKVLFKITYFEDTQDKTGPNASSKNTNN